MTPSILIQQKPVEPVKPTKKSTWPVHFIYEIKTKGHDVMGVNVFHTKLIKSTKKVNSVPTILLTWNSKARYHMIHQRRNKTWTVSILFLSS